MRKQSQMPRTWRQVTDSEAERPPSGRSFALKGGEATAGIEPAFSDLPGGALDQLEHVAIECSNRTLGKGFRSTCHTVKNGQIRHLVDRDVDNPYVVVNSPYCEHAV
jgi:hypothetical protein